MRANLNKLGNMHIPIFHCPKTFVANKKGRLRMQPARLLVKSIELKRAEYYTRPGCSN